MNARSLAAALLALTACGPADPADPAPGRHVEVSTQTGGAPEQTAIEDLADAPGRWHRSPGLTEEHARSMAQLEAIGYAAGSEPGAGASGVTVHDPERASAGLSFYTSGHGPEALLIAMDGAVRHRWRLPATDVWPDEPDATSLPGALNWRRARLFPNGDVVAIFAGVGIVRMTASSQVVWSHRARVHHDLDVAPDGTIWTLSRRLGVRPEVHPTEPIVDDTLLVLSAAGEVVRELSMIDAFRSSAFADEAFRLDRGDLFHTNAIELLDGRLADRLPAFRAGNVLVSLRVPDLLAVVDPDAETVVWTHRGRYRKQHDPRLLADGHLLLFDNLGLGDRSRILEFDPVTGDRAWALGKTAGPRFYSETCGTVARLANGNTLVCESDGGRALEVTPDRKLVWEFLSPHRAGANGEYVATLFDLERLPADFPTAWLD